MVEKRNEHGTVGTPPESASGNGDVGLMGQLDDGTETQIASEQNGHRSGERLRPWCLEILLLLLVFFVYAGDAAPMVNEAHYLSKAKNFWNPDCASRHVRCLGKGPYNVLRPVWMANQIFDVISDSMDRSGGGLVVAGDRSATSIVGNLWAAVSVFGYRRALDLGNRVRKSRGRVGGWRH